jgi:hypothetical protein
MPIGNEKRLIGDQRDIPGVGSYCVQNDILKKQHMSIQLRTHNTEQPSRVSPGPCDYNHSHTPIKHGVISRTTRFY